MTETLKNNFPCVFGAGRPSDPDQRITRMPSFAGFTEAAAQDSMFKVCEFATFLATIYTGGMVGCAVNGVCVCAM